MQVLVLWTLRDDFESKSKKLKKLFVSIASNFTRLETETDRYVKNIIFATTFFHLVAGKKQLRMIVNAGQSKGTFVEIVIP